MSGLEELKGRRGEILQRAADHGANHVRVFGSAARGDARPGGDVDLVVQMEPGRSLIDFVALWQELEDLLDSRVDLVSEGGISPHMRERILSEAVEL